MNDCSDCAASLIPAGTTTASDRRQFLRTAAAAVGAATLPVGRTVAEEPAAPARTPENLVQTLFASLKPEQRDDICFAWDHKDDRGLLRMHVSNNWHITDRRVGSDFFTADQRDMIEAIFWGLYDPEWKDRIQKQLKDDAGGYGIHQSIALFGEPGKGPFEFVMTGRHLTIRCDGNSVAHTAFGGPIFYGHAAAEFNEPADHRGNVYWPQALAANRLFEMLDGKQREAALIPQMPAERMVHFRKSADDVPGLRISELSADQKAHAEKVLAALVEPYRQGDREEVSRCLSQRGGLEQCRLAFYESPDLGNDRVWDNWRLEGPSFVWHYRGSPHVHVWVNVADDPAVEITTRG